MVRRGTSFILLLASGCGSGKPELPASISPSWILKGVEKANECWKGNYADAAGGSADVLICGNSSPGPVAANTVNFQKGGRSVAVKWNGVSREEIKALVLAIQRSVK